MWVIHPHAHPRHHILPLLHCTEGEVETGLPGERGPGGGAGEGAPGGRWGQLALLQLLHQLFLRQAAGWGGKELGQGGQDKDH